MVPAPSSPVQIRTRPTVDLLELNEDVLRFRNVGSKFECRESIARSAWNRMGYWERFPMHKKPPVTRNRPVHIVTASFKTSYSDQKKLTSHQLKVEQRMPRQRTFAGQEPKKNTRNNPAWDQRGRRQACNRHDSSRQPTMFSTVLDLPPRPEHPRDAGPRGAILRERSNNFSHHWETKAGNILLSLKEHSWASTTAPLKLLSNQPVFHRSNSAMQDARETVHVLDIVATSFMFARVALTRTDVDLKTKLRTQDLLLVLVVQHRHDHYMQLYHVQLEVDGQHVTTV